MVMDSMVLAFTNSNKKKHMHTCTRTFTHTVISQRWTFRQVDTSLVSQKTQREKYFARNRNKKKRTGRNKKSLQSRVTRKITNEALKQHDTHALIHTHITNLNLQLQIKNMLGRKRVLIWYLYAENFSPHAGSHDSTWKPTTALDPRQRSGGLL